MVPRFPLRGFLYQTVRIARQTVPIGLSRPRSGKGLWPGNRSSARLQRDDGRHGKGGHGAGEHGAASYCRPSRHWSGYRSGRPSSGRNRTIRNHHRPAPKSGQRLPELRWGGWRYRLHRPPPKCRQRNTKRRRAFLTGPCSQRAGRSRLQNRLMGRRRARRPPCHRAGYGPLIRRTPAFLPHPARRRRERLPLPPLHRPPLHQPPRRCR